ncbi:MAG: hypothetical protein U0610_00155 [bacterium]
MKRLRKSSLVVRGLASAGLAFGLVSLASAEDPQPAAPAPTAPIAPPLPAHGGMGMPPGHPSMSGGTNPGMPPGMGMGAPAAPLEAAKPDAEGLVHARGIKFAVPSGWTLQPPTSAMRIVQATVTGEGGKADLVLFHFGGGQGGDRESNIERWITQIDSPAGTKAERDSFEVKSAGKTFQVATVTVAGTLKASGMGMGPSAPQPNSRLLGAVVEGEGGPWFFKLTGDDKTVKAAQSAFVTMLKGLRPE